MADGRPIWIVGVIVAFMCILAYFLSPKGPNKVVIQSSLILTLLCLYIMWAVTYLAQLNPLISPRRIVEAHEGKEF
ncbi:ATP synthase subunit H-domain-containing protein [Paraphysoderma sedebokerense]|nr:ATP synthase subunit H-domain-containing protein [Paraphysoderma sedebokerense]